MTYSEDFKSLLEYAPNDFIGFGNPNAKILILTDYIDKSIGDISHEAKYDGQAAKKLERLIQEIYGLDTKEHEIDINSYMYHTTMCTIDSGISPLAQNLYSEVYKSVLHRIGILSADFFRSFKLIIAFVGNYPRDMYGDEYFPDIFNTEFIGNEEQEVYKWLNVNIRKDSEHPLLLIHCRALSDDEVDDKFLCQLADKVNEFAHQHNINLTPTE